jgi:hypothetical protein
MACPDHITPGSSFRKNWYTAYAINALAVKAPYVFTNWVQFAIKFACPTGPFSAIPTNAPVEVPTPSIGFTPEDFSSTYTPGDRYSEIGRAHV